MMSTTKVSGTIQYFLIGVFLIGWSTVSCDEKKETLAPYLGNVPMSSMQIEEGSFVPKITWVGGYVSALGVNKGSRAALDSTLVWLVEMDEDDIHFPVKYGVLPNNSAEVTAVYGGTKTDSLKEDAQYTFWAVKKNVWIQISEQKGKIVRIDSTLAENTIDMIADTIGIDRWSHTQKTQALDVYVNIGEFTSRGKLADLLIEKSMSSNNPVITWKIKQSGVTDSLVSLCGLSKGQQYNLNKIIWEVWSVEEVGGKQCYGTQNVISSPIVLGQDFEGTRTFKELSASGLERNMDYYFWIANSAWDGESRTRFANNYAFISFTTW